MKEPVLCEECGTRPATCIGYYDGSCTAVRSCAACCDHDGICTEIEAMTDMISFTWEEAKTIADAMARIACESDGESFTDEEVKVLVRMRATFPILDGTVSDALRRSNHLRTYENKPEHAR